MDKPMLVLLPLTTMLVALGLLVLSGRRPPRWALNAAFSVLLLVYLLATAGLGLFWVANQQLPVFDWHYLFGYATLALLVVHLAFNARTLWQQLRRLASSMPAGAPAAPGRRPLLGALSLAGVAAAIGYLVGLRHGRTELVVAAAAGAAPPASAAEGSSAVAWAVQGPDTGGWVERFHAHAAHARGRLLRRAAGGWPAPPPPFKRHDGGPRVLLPAPAQDRARRGNARIDIAQLGDWLWHAAGITLERGGLALRAAPSSGALFATELYLAVDDVDSLAPGWWHYDPRTHALQRPWPDAPSVAPQLEAAGVPPAAVTVVASAVFARSGHKYGDRTYRYLLADLGHLLENLRVAVTAGGRPPPAWLARFDDRQLAAALRLDPTHEGVLAVAAIDPRSAPPALAWANGAAAPTAAAAAQPGLSSADLTAAVHQLCSLSALGPGPAPATRDWVLPQAPAGDRHALPAPRVPAANALAVIARRRSVRRFSDRALPLQRLADVLAVMSAPAPAYSGAIVVDVVSTRVESLPRATWRWHRGALVPLVRHGEDLAARARAAALDQDVIGDAAAVFVLSLDRRVLAADALGAARAYRHGFIEAGLVGERLYLAAGALGLGACAVGAFYDDEVHALNGRAAADEWVVHLAALGWPA